MDVRDATDDDLPAILAIYNHCVLHSTCTADVEPQALAARQAWLDERRAAGLPVLVAIDGGEVVGWAALSRYHARPGYRFTVENSVYVHHQRRGLGAGRALLDALVRRARALGLHVIIAGVDGDNQASLSLHERAGFRYAGRLPQVVHKFDRWLDVVYLQLTL